MEMYGNFVEIPAKTSWELYHRSWSLGISMKISLGHVDEFQCMRSQTTNEPLVDYLDYMDLLMGPIDNKNIHKYIRCI